MGKEMKPFKAKIIITGTYRVNPALYPGMKSRQEMVEFDAANVHPDVLLSCCDTIHVEGVVLEEKPKKRKPAPRRKR
jgi:hypothetical protein